MFRSRASRVIAAAVVAVAAVVVVVAGLRALRPDDSGETGSGGSLGSSVDRPRPPRPQPDTPEARLSQEQAVDRVRRSTPWVTRGGSRGRLIALTFDDGPGLATPAIIAELRRMDAPATFFPVGSEVHQSPDVARAQTRTPFAVGSHTATHARLSRLGRSAQFQQIFGGARAQQRVTGNRPRIFRPPYGDFDDTTLRLLREQRTLMVLWTFSAYDWKHPDADYIARRVLRLARPGAIVLMHDGGGGTRVPTLRALPRIVDGLRRRGYRLVTVPRLLQQAPPDRRLPRPRSPYPG